MVELPRLGMGTAALGNLYRAVSDEQAAETIEAALTGGIRYFDTAPHYGFGLAEERLGCGLGGRGDIIVSTKVGRLLEPVENPARERHGFVEARPFEPIFDYSDDAVLRSLDESLARLRRDRVDILFAHDIGRLTHGERHEERLRQFLDEGYPAMRRLRDEGAIDAIGIGVNEVEICLDLIDRIDLDLILLAGRYTLLDRSAAERLLPACAARGIRLVVGGPYNSGILARPIGEDARFDYAPASDAVLSRARALQGLCDRFDAPLPAAALQFPLRHPAVASVIPGMASAAEVADTLARFSAPVNNDLWAAVSEVPA
ncbi:aldo/keto reductase [Sphingomonas oryzagri]